MSPVPSVPVPTDLVHGVHGDLLVVAKPAGIPCFPPHADPAGDCVLARLVAAGHVAPEADYPPGFAGGIAHRLDISTSGQLLVARSPAALARLRAAFSAHRLHKRYLLWTARSPGWARPGATTTVDRPVAHDRKKKGRMVVQRGATTPHRGRWLPAETAFTVLARAAGGWLVQAEMRTGVMHQIRVHAGFAGLAIAGDRHYGGGPLPPGQPPALRFLLHHCGLTGPGLAPPAVPLPGHWPAPDDGGHRGPPGPEAGC